MKPLELFPGRGPTAVFSACEVCGTTELCERGHPRQPYRYLLRWPTGVEVRTAVAFILANPSTAVPYSPDPTVTRCINYGRAWGYGEVLVGNARAWRETDPDLVPPDPQAIGPHNDEILRLIAAEADLVVCGWGNLGKERGAPVLDVVRLAGKVPHAFGWNADGSPKHPLYLKKSLRPQPFPETA